MVRQPRPNHKELSKKIRIPKSHNLTFRSEVKSVLTGNSSLVHLTGPRACGKREYKTCPLQHKRLGAGWGWPPRAPECNQTGVPSHCAIHEGHLSLGSHSSPSGSQLRVWASTHLHTHAPHCLSPDMDYKTAMWFL